MIYQNMLLGFRTPEVIKYQRWGVKTTPIPIYESKEEQEETRSFRSAQRATMDGPTDRSYKIKNPGFRRKAPGETNQAIHLHDSFRNERLGQKVHVVMTKDQQDKEQADVDKAEKEKAEAKAESKRQADLEAKRQALLTSRPLFPEPIQPPDGKHSLPADEGPPDYSTLPQSTKDADRWPDSKELAPDELSDFQTMDLQDVINQFRVRRKDGAGKQFQIGGPTYNEEVRQHGVDSMYLQRYGEPRSKKYPKLPTTGTRRPTRKRTGSL